MLCRGTSRTSSPTMALPTARACSQRSFCRVAKQPAQLSPRPDAADWAGYHWQDGDNRPGSHSHLTHIPQGYGLPPPTGWVVNKFEVLLGLHGMSTRQTLPHFGATEMGQDAILHQTKSPTMWWPIGTRSRWSEVIYRNSLNSSYATILFDRICCRASRRTMAQHNTSCYRKSEKPG